MAIWHDNDMLHVSSRDRTGQKECTMYGLLLQRKQMHFEIIQSFQMSTLFKHLEYVDTHFGKKNMLLGSAT